MNPSPTNPNVNETPTHNESKPVSDAIASAVGEGDRVTTETGDTAAPPAAPNGEGRQSPASTFNPPVATAAGTIESTAGSSEKQTASQEHTSEEKDANASAGASTDGDKGKDVASTVASAVPGRIPTPSSRTSTPPLAAAATKKKFSSVSVNKEFLSKAASPTPAPAKLARPAAAAAPAPSTTRLLSSKLTTVPSSKISTSPKPAGPTPTATTTASPWAKTAAPPPESPQSSALLQHPAPTRGHGLPNMAMGSGQGIGSAARRAWGNVGPDGRRLGGQGLSRDFPTAKEVADGKQAALMVAQAEAAHNQAILAGLNEFTHLEPNKHRWDEEDDDDEMIDFGDGRSFAAPKESEVITEPVPKSQRFGEDIGRSWPRRASSPSKQRGEGGRVLFNASSNRLEPSNQQGAGTRLMTRDAPPASSAQDRGPGRAPPPHLAGDGSRPLPPHLTTPHPGPQGPPLGGRSWRNQPEREAPPHAEHREREPRHDMHPPRPPPVSRPPPPHTQTHRHPPTQPPPASSPVATTAALPTTAPAGVTGDTQAAEMHSAAEKARLRRLAEEAEREAAAERARQKARALSERFGDSTSNPKTSPAAPTVALGNPSDKHTSTSPIAPPPGLPKPPPPPGMSKPTPQITIATRPRPDPQQGPSEVQSADVQVHPADRSTSWRRAGPLDTQPHTTIPETDPRMRRRPSADQVARPEAGRRFTRDGPPGREIPPHAAHVPQHGQREQASRELPPHVGSEGKSFEGPELAAPVPSKKEADWDAMLARLQAVMGKAKTGDPEAPSVDSLVAMSRAPLAQPVSPTASTNPPVPKPKVIKPSPGLNLPHLPPDYFDATEPGLPRSPPPAWRQYTVKIPQGSTKRVPNIPRWRLKAAEGPGPHSPAGWWMTFEPPIAQLPPSLVVSDLLLPLPLGRRTGKHVDAGPLVSISPRVLVLHERKSKRKTPEQSQADGKRPVAPEPSQTQQPLAQEAPSAPSVSGPKRGPAKADKDRRFLVDGGTAPGADKPGVRFMVSSELDGDSLLDEVNKMSLEHIGEYEDKGGSKVTQERPKTPPAAQARASATSPSSASGPWAKSTLAYPVTSPARTAPQHDHLKSVWEGTADTTAQQSSAPTTAPSQPETPLYPSLNAPVTTPDAQTQTLKPGFSPMGQPGSSSFGIRSALGQSGYQYPMGSGGASPDGGMGMQYGLMGRSNSGANGFQQGLWSSSFGSSLASPGYNYGAKGGNDQKTGAGLQQFSPGPTKEGVSPSQYGNDYRYSAQQGGNGFQPGGGAYNGYPAGGQYRNPNTNSLYGPHSYAHSGFGTQMAAPRGSTSRFPSVGVNGGVDYQAMGYDPATTGYYSSGGYAPQPQYGVQQQQGGGRGGAVGRKMW